MKTRIKKGISLVELMVVIATSAFLILAAGIVLSLGHTSWNKEWKKVCLQREAAYLMVEMTQPIKGAISATTPGDDGKHLRIYNNEGDQIEFEFIPEENVLEKSINGGTKIDVTDNAENVTFSVSESIVTITLALESDGLQTQSVSTIMMRNYGG